MPTPTQVVLSNTLTTTIAATSGGGTNSLIVVVNSFGTAVPTISSVKLGTTTLTLVVDKVFSSGGNQVSTWIFWANDIPTGQTSVVVSGTNLVVTSGSGGITILEVPLLTGLDTSTPNSSEGTGTTWSVSTAAATSQANEFAVASSCTNVPNNPAGWTNNQDAGGGYVTGYQTTSSITSLTYNGTQTSSPYTAAIATFLAGAPPAAPGTPTGLEVTGETSTTVSLQWTAPSSGGPVTTYTVYVNGTPASPVSGTSTTVIDLSPSTTYSFTVQANGPGGSGPQSSAVNGTTSEAPPILIASIAPEGGTDQFGYNFVSGVGIYSINATPGVIIQLINDNITFTSDAFPMGVPAFIQADSGFTFISSGSESNEAQAELTMESATKSGTGSAQSTFTGNVIIHGQSIVPQPPPTATAAAIITALQASGLFT